jgi:hypothetical protein
MKNKITIVSIGIIFGMLLLGCGLNPFSGSSKPSNSRSSSSNDKTIEDKAVDTAVGDEKIGIPECDDVIDSLANETRSEDEGYIVKAFRAYYVNKIREAIKKSIEENKGNPVKLAKECKDLKTQLDKYKAEEKSKQ